MAKFYITTSDKAREGLIDKVPGYVTLNEPRRWTKDIHAATAFDSRDDAMALVRSGRVSGGPYGIDAFKIIERSE